MENAQRIVIAGGGMVGQCLALAIRAAGPGIAVTLVEAGRAPHDGRTSAIGAGPRRMLESLGLWEEIAGKAQPINSMAIGDTRLGDVGRPVFLHFDGPVEEGEPFAHMVPNAVLRDAFSRHADAAGIETLARSRVVDFTVSSSGLTAKIDGPDGSRALSAALLVAADGSRSRLRALAGIATIEKDYGQSAIVCTVEHERPHEGRARQDFLAAGPFAVLPLAGNRSSLVWTDRPAFAESMRNADPLVLRAELELRFGHELGAARVTGPVETYPLRLVLARSFVAERFALCGDAAHAIHPLAGQGLNLGLKDVAALAEAIVEGARLGLDIGSQEVLRRYQSWRRYDTMEMALATDGLNRLFSVDLAPVRLLRDVGLGLVDRLPWLKRGFMARAAGLGNGLPRLLRGEAL
jgi:2-octaprenyl-6-methoxyphenol hydroxylase